MDCAAGRDEQAARVVADPGAGLNFPGIEHFDVRAERAPFAGIGVDAMQRLDRVRRVEPALLAAAAIDVVLAHEPEEHVGGSSDCTYEPLAALAVTTDDLSRTNRRERRHHEAAGATGRTATWHRSFE